MQTGSTTLLRVARPLRIYGMVKSNAELCQKLSPTWVSFMGIIKINGKEIKYRIRTSSRSRRMCIKLNRDLQLEVVVPQGQREDVESFLRKEGGWIEGKYEELSRCNKVIGDGRMLYRGVYCPIVNLHSNEGGDGNVRLESGKIIVNGLSLSNYSNLTKWLKSETTAYVNARTPELSRRFGLSYNNIYVRSISAWGLCSIRVPVPFQMRDPVQCSFGINEPILDG